MVYYLLLIILFAAAVFGIYYKYDGELASVKKQAILLSRQNKSLKVKMNAHTERVRNFQMKRINPESSKAIITKQATLRISPLQRAMPINSLEENDIVSVNNIVEIDKTKWYEINISSKSKINDLGWINGESISMIDNSFTEFDNV